MTLRPTALAIAAETLRPQPYPLEPGTYRLELRSPHQAMLRFQGNVIVSATASRPASPWHHLTATEPLSVTVLQPSTLQVLWLGIVDPAHPPQIQLQRQ